MLELCTFKDCTLLLSSDIPTEDAFNHLLQLQLQSFELCIKLLLQTILSFSTILYLIDFSNFYLYFDRVFLAGIRTINGRRQT